MQIDSQFLQSQSVHRTLSQYPLIVDRGVCLYSYYPIRMVCWAFIQGQIIPI